jgi:ABC-2 type transport system ATP-binding protein
MTVIEATGLTHHYGRVRALDNVDLAVPEGAVYALLGPNGAGKTTLLRILMRLQRPTVGRVSLLGKDVSALTLGERASIGYVAEGQALPRWMRLEQLEAYLAPLYPTWDRSLADELRRRFRLDAQRKLRTLSRGEAMKAALQCTLAPRPRLLLMDEPFTGMDALVKDELVRGLLETAGTEGWTVLISSHDLAELETLADWVGFLDEGRLLLSEPMETMRERFRRVEVVSPDPGPGALSAIPAEWLSVERSGPRLSFVLQSRADRVGGDDIRDWFPAAARIETRVATLREVFVALATRTRDETRREKVAV